MIFINSNQLLKMINEGRLTLIIDVRDEEDYMLGHIPKAVNIPMEIILSKLEELYQYKDEVILIYCAKGQSSAIVCKYLESKGFSNVYNLLNGINNYISKGE